MNVLLLSMPDSFEHMSSITIRMPNGALSSLAGNVDAHHRVSDCGPHPRPGAGPRDRRSAWFAGNDPM